MIEQRVERKLAAILATDIVGYSRLMEADEEGTHARLRELRREFIEPTVAANRGRIIKTTGDGALTEFASVVDAVRCAVDMQRGMIARNADLAQNRCIVFRMGVNLGDVIVEEHDIYGDGVNVAARLEGLSEPGGLLISGTVYDHVREKVPYAFTDKGEQTVKNISHPVRVYAFGANAIAALPDMPTASVRPVGEPGLVSDAAQRLSIVVLPFTNLSSDPDQDYFVDGVSDSLITDLSRGMPGSFVIARSTAFTYKDKAVDARQIGRDLGVRYLLNGSILRSGEKLRVNAQLIDAQTGAHLWAERFDKDRIEFLKMQDEIVARIARSVGLQVVDEEARRAARKEPLANPNAADLAMRGWALLNRSHTRESNAAALGLFQDALRIDDHNVDAWVGVASVHINDVSLLFYVHGNEERLGLADEALARALALDPNNVHVASRRCGLYRMRQRFDEAVRACDRAIALNPADPWPYLSGGFARIDLGLPEQSFAWFEQAGRVGPRDPSSWASLYGIAFAHFVLGHDEEAIEWSRKASEANPDSWFPSASLAAAHALLGHDAQAQRALRECLRLNPGLTIKRLEANRPSSIPASLALRERYLAGLRKAGLPEE